jgi:hypothetical protein
MSFQSQICSRCGASLMGTKGLMRAWLAHNGWTAHLVGTEEQWLCADCTGMPEAVVHAPRPRGHRTLTIAFWSFVIGWLLGLAQRFL